MTRIAIIAAGGESKRTGLGAYTTKAALTLAGRTLLQHQLDFCWRSGIDRAIVVCRPEHARLLGSQLSYIERRGTAFVMLSPDGALGWAGTVAHAMGHVGDEDEVVLLPCDNYQTAPAVEQLKAADSLFTYTEWTNPDVPPTNGPVFALDYAWGVRPGPGFVGSMFTGYVVARGGVLREALRGLQLSDRGELEMTALLSALQGRGGCLAVPYSGTYEDVADLAALARLNARLIGAAVKDGLAYPYKDWPGEADVGAAVLLHDGEVLLAEREDGRGWVMPGGLVDRGESLAHAAARECLEEVGIVVAERDLRLLGVYPTIGKDARPAVSVVFHAAVRPPFRFQLDSREVHSAQWFTREEAAKLTIPFDLDKPVTDYFAGRELDCR